MTFAQYVELMVKRHQLHRQIDGTTAILMISLSTEVPILIVYDMVNPRKRAQVTSGTYAVPISKVGRERFFQFVLNFNRDSLNNLNVGLKPMNAEGSVFTLFWYVPKVMLTEREWEGYMRLFEEFSVLAKQGSNRVIQEWMHFLH